MAAISTSPKKSGKQRRKRPWERTCAWIRAHAQEYPGYWLAVAGDRLIAADPDVEVVIAAVERTPTDERPLLFFQDKPVD